MFSLAALAMFSISGTLVYCQSEAARLLTQTILYGTLLLFCVYCLVVALFTPHDLYLVMNAVFNFFSHLVEPHAFDGIARWLHGINKALIGG